MNRILRSIAAVTTACLINVALPPLANAGLVSTEDATVSVRRAELVGRLDTMLARTEVQHALAARGADANQVRERVAALTDEEADQLAQRIDQLPAGGDWVTIVVVVFVVLVVTDLLGLTKIFPFTRPVR